MGNIPMVAWAERIRGEVANMLTTEPNPAIREGLALIEKGARHAVEAYRRAALAVPNLVMDMLKVYVHEQLERAENMAHGVISSIQLQQQLTRRDDDELSLGRSPHCNRYTVVVFKPTAPDTHMPIHEFHVGDSDDPGINSEEAMRLVCLWLSEYAKECGCEIVRPNELRLDG